MSPIASQVGEVTVAERVSQKTHEEFAPDCKGQPDVQRCGYMGYLICKRCGYLPSFVDQFVQFEVERHFMLREAQQLARSATLARPGGIHYGRNYHSKAVKDVRERARRKAEVFKGRLTPFTSITFVPDEGR